MLESMEIMVTKKMTAEQQQTYARYHDIFPFRIVEFINDIGIRVIATEMKNNISGSIAKTDNTFTIYVNDTHAPTRLRFTLAHELGHYFNDRKYLESNDQIQDLSKQAMSKVLYRKESPSIDVEMQKMDIEANKFAANILMPEEKFKELWNKEDTPEKVARFFGVSVEAVKIRASFLLGEIF
ncbi:MAG: ImmA/IrrE family metallo-endopeptidase [Alphaproteobacteria bacterium]|nr:ImmA/IrrE family metallo-endopeptidase [Alphaproteobacteria bacterium]